MTEVVVAVYKTASAAETATADLEVARVPTATVRQFVSDPAADEQLLEVRNRGTTSGDRVVAVTVKLPLDRPRYSCARNRREEPCTPTS